MNLNQNIRRIYQLINEQKNSSLDNEKLFRVAKKLLPILKVSMNPTEMFNQLIHMSNTKEYFNALGLEKLIKISIISYYLQQNQDEKKIDKVLNNLKYPTLLTTENENHKDECGTCDGSGKERCEECYGEGHEECSECEGSGQMPCDTCDGEKKVEDEDGNMVDCNMCDGKGEEDCSSCDGSGRRGCNYCGGSGEYDCDDCGGDGEIQTDEIDYTIYGICSWDNNLNEILEIKDHSQEPAIEDLDSFKKKILIFYEDTFSDEMDRELVPGEYYSISFDDELQNFSMNSHLRVSLIYNPSIRQHLF